MNSIYTLETWLQTATNDLTPEAVVSIRKEITDHVKTTLERQTSAGLSQVEAEKVAVTLLGDPKKSAKKFNRVHLTKKDEEALQSMRKKVIFYILYGLFHLTLGLNGMKTVLWLAGRRSKGTYFNNLNTNYLPWIFQELSYIMIAFSIFSACLIVINLKKVGKLRTLIIIHLIFAILMIIFPIFSLAIDIFDKANLPKSALFDPNIVGFFSETFYPMIWFSFYIKIRKLSTRVIT